MKTIVFIAPQLSQPRIIKRIESIAAGVFKVKVFGFDNGLYKNNIENAKFKIDEVIPRIKEASRISKILFFVKAIRRIIATNKKESIFYLFGYEIGCIAFFLGCRSYIYEEADVSAAREKNNFIRRLMIMMDKKVIYHSKLTVLTSGGFAEYIFDDKKPSNIVLMPNKLSAWFNSNYANRETLRGIDYNNIKFGFVGLIRYPNTIIRFAKVIGKFFPMHEFHFYGDIERADYIDEEIKSFDNVFFHGPFLNPQDLSQIYSKIDVNVVCYDTESGNVRIAEPNKLYESIYFRVPIIVSSNTYLANRVDELNVGDNIDASNDEVIIAYINSLTSGHFENFISHMKNIPDEELIDNSETLINALRKLI